MDKRDYFPALDTLRLYAALCVVVTHVDIVAPAGLSTISGLFMHGSSAVTLFFVLSGFLITYRLLREQQRTGTISIKRFYARRSLRIWPLYYLIVVLCYFVLPMVPGFLAPRPETLPYALTFSVEIPHALTWLVAMSWAGHLWSIGVEELYYLLWPVLLKRYRLISVCILVIGLRVIANSLAPMLPQHWAQLVYFLRFECMAIGALAAYAVLRAPMLTRMLSRPILIYAALLLVIAINFRLAGGNIYAESLVYAAFMVGLVRGDRLRWMRSPRLARWGAYTYGIYMWHFPVIGIVTSVAPQATYAEIFAVVMLVTVALAIVSYVWIERPFLRLYPTEKAQSKFAAGIFAPEP